MKGGSITALLLNTIFITALSRAFNVSLEQVLSRPALPASLTNHTTCTESDAQPTCDSEAQTSSESGVKFEHALSSKCEEVATIIDAFASTYQATYRSVLLFDL